MSFSKVLPVALLSATLAFAADVTDPAPASVLELGVGQKLITILGTNDIHGGVEASLTRDGATVGGLAYWAGVTQSIRQGLARQFGDQAGVLVVDAGDQFQGTLISNYNEGQLVFAAMNEVGYDAVIPGNHDYDFGPIGWLEDQVSDSTASADRHPRGALLRLVSQAKFPLLSANTFLKEGAVDLDFDSELLRPRKPKTPKPPKKPKLPGADDPRRPSFLEPYVIKEVAGVRVALVGLDNPGTPSTTTAANVSDLKFEDEAPAYLRVRAELEGQADVFVIVVHDGNTSNSFDATKLVEKLPAGSVDAVIAGHTHYVNNARVKGVPIIQSGSGGTMFGRVDLVWDPKARKLDASRLRAIGGINLFHARCAPAAQAFCAERDGVVSYEGVPVVKSAAVESLIAQARHDVAPLAKRKLGTALGPVTVDRKSESALANALTDTLRALSGADVAFMNTGGIRAPIAAGDITYEDLFRVVPFNNHGLVLGPMSLEQVVGLLNKSIQTCGAFGALMQSGLQITYRRDCTKGDIDPAAELLSVRSFSGEELYAGGAVRASREFKVATLDFLAAGGSGFTGFKGAPVLQDLGIVRELMADELEKHPAQWSSQPDGRWAEAPAKP